MSSEARAKVCLLGAGSAQVPLPVPIEGHARLPLLKWQDFIARHGLVVKSLPWRMGLSPEGREHQKSKNTVLVFVPMET